jgi:hypothetical protein
MYDNLVRGTKGHVVTRRPLAERGHEQLHKLPGMPEHSEGTRLNRQGGLPNRPLRNRPLKSPRISHGHEEPKVLVGWQNAIARFLSRHGR